eukprot:gene7593-13398_t
MAPNRLTADSCGISPWDNWGECYTSCGEGTKSRYRHVVASAICGGSCKYSLRENAICYDFTERHCKVGLWSAWPTCVGVCPGEAVRRSRYKTIRERCVACTYETWDQKICNGTGWTNWSTCNATCGLNGTTTRTNRCLGPTTLVEQLDSFGTCCSDSCSRGYYEIGELPDCKCVVNKTHWIWRKSSSAYLGNQYCKHVLPILGIWSLLYIGYS